MTKTNKHIAAVRYQIEFIRDNTDETLANNVAIKALTHLEELERCCNCQEILDSSE